MRNWRTVPLERIAEIRSSNVDKKSNPGEEAVRLCNYMDVYSRDYITGDIDFMEATATPAEIQRFGVERGDVMITKDSETPDDIGIPSVVVDEIPGLVCGYHLALIKPKRDEVDPIYLTKQLGLPDTARYFGRLANGSTRYGLSFQSVAKTPIRLAPLPQQQRIAEILSTVDEAIEQTEALIAKTQQIKAGLMHGLFTRGVTADGQLRPPREEAPQLYKESLLGWIPKEWEVLPLVALCGADITYGIVQAGPHVDGGVPYIRTGDMAGERLTKESLLCTSPKIAAAYRRSEVRAGEIVCAIRATVGKVLPIPEELDGANLTQGTARISPSEIIEPTFLLWSLRTSRTQAWLATQIKGTTFSEITLGNLRQFPVACPIKKPEQAAIAERIASCAQSITETCKEQDKLHELKLGLMRDLLNGRVGVTEAALAMASDIGSTACCT